MEQHPVPQNVTTFQFRLIGDMTIKQFGYLAGGVILAYISYKLPLPFFFTWPMVIVFALGGFGFAFVPVEERPMDVWVLSFLKRIYSPTLFVWQKAPPAQETQAPKSAAAAAKGAPALGTVALPQSASHSPQSRSVADVVGGVFGSPKPIMRVAPVTPAAPALPQVHAGAVRKESGVLSWITELFSFRGQPKKQPGVSLASAPHVSTPTVTGRHLDVSPPPTVSTLKAAQQQAAKAAEQKETALEGKLQELKKELESKTMTESRILDLQKQLTEVLAQKDKMESEVMMLRRQAAAPASGRPISSAARISSRAPALPA